MPADRTEANITAARAMIALATATWRAKHPDGSRADWTAEALVDPVLREALFLVTLMDAADAAWLDEDEETIICGFDADGPLLKSVKHATPDEIEASRTRRR